MNSRKIGVLGEKIAIRYLQNKGYQVLDRNFIFRIPGFPQKGEIDIIAKKGDTIFFIEAKTIQQREGNFFKPEDKVNLKKQKKLGKTAQSWLMKKNLSLDSKWQIDILSIIINLKDKKAKIRHFQNI